MIKKNEKIKENNIKICEHKLKNPSSFIVVVLRSLMHRGCVRCRIPIKTLDESFEHWEKELKQPPLFEFDLGNG